MRPKLELLSSELVGRVQEEAFRLLEEPGVMVQLPEARELLASAGAQVDEIRQVVRLPEVLSRQALASVPREFFLYNRDGEPVVRYGDDCVHFDPGSCGVHVLDPGTLAHRSSMTGDLLRVIRIAEMLPQLDAQSTALVCSEVPKPIGDLYRLYLVMLYSKKPVVTGAFSARTTQAMIDLLAVYSGGREALRAKPTAVFDVCPTPPLIWSKFGAQNLIDLARAGVPAEIVSMPLAGVASPVTLIGSIVQHAAECISGIVIHQVAGAGAPIVWGGAPAVFDMRQGTTPYGAIETAMIDAGYAQVGKAFGLPTHAYLGASDAKIVDAQAGMESALTAMIGALAGINMISGAGMLDSLACVSPEKLVLDAEGIDMAKRLLRGIETPTQTLALELFAGIAFKPDFLKQRFTRDLFKQEQYLPSPTVDRKSLRAWQAEGCHDAFSRAWRQAEELLSAYRRPQADPAMESELKAMVSCLAKEAGMEKLPELEKVD